MLNFTLYLCFDLKCAGFVLVGLYGLWQGLVVGLFGISQSATKYSCDD